MTLNPNAEKWVEDLTSGNYDQVQGHLRDDFGFCCLGVACDTFKKMTGRGIWVKSTYSYPNVNPGYSPFVETKWTFLVGEEIADVALPSAVKDWLGLDHNEGHFREHGPYNDTATLSGMNDSGSNFETIAEMIKSEPRMLFTN